MYVKSIPENAEFDYVIVGAGSAGCVLADRLSASGKHQVLQRHGIDVRHHLPGVGENLRDHPNTRLTYECSQPITINDVLRSPWLKMKEGLRFIFKREGLLTICSATAQMNHRSSDKADQPDLVLRLLPLSGKDRYARTPDKGLDPHAGFTFGVTVLQPHSRGICHVQSNDPMQQAAMDPQYLSHEPDAQLFLDGIRVAHNPLLMVVHPSFNVKTVKDLIALAKAQPGVVNFATGGIGSSPHMSMELLKSMARIDMVPIHYKGDGAAVKEQITKLGLEIVGNTPEQYATFLRSENVRWGNMVRQLKLKAD